jgi:hypothetical protein
MKLLQAKPSWIHNFTLKQYDIKVVTLTLEIYRVIQIGIRAPISFLF